MYYSNNRIENIDKGVNPLKHDDKGEYSAKAQNSSPTKPPEDLALNRLHEATETPTVRVLSQLAEDGDPEAARWLTDMAGGRFPSAFRRSLMSRHARKESDDYLIDSLELEPSDLRGCNFDETFWDDLENFSETGGEA